jgi:hypothetical protein
MLKRIEKSTMLYDHEKALKSTEERIKRNIPQPNQDLILDYESHCFAQGLKIAVSISNLRVISTSL